MTLVHQNEIDTSSLLLWQQSSFAEVRSRLSDGTEFPCLFAQNAFRREIVKISFVETLDDVGLEKARSDLLEYVKRCEHWDGKVNSAEPLLMIFNPENVSSDSVEDYHKLGWQVLQYFHDNDDMPWPEGTAQAPNSPYWSMAFHGLQLFVNMSSPAHQVRKSRNLGAALTLVINPRERFDIVAGETEEGRRTRAKIRRRVEVYDGYSHCPQLGSYAAGEIEWWQYGIIEENRDRTDRCPLHQRADAKDEQEPHLAEEELA
ncbi:YqcI/YcgG family protein [Pseudovibrio axinellae]|uniref:YqcI/YcgG family protein n=1 Tax=Pseudovibrio axinellae TaxID=989403 RepID=A0A165U0S7_9HYPH|nr:YqcI/YcgG family protein [Pseudovibrio axinellae]KZL09107.1 YqcI/YcgG family protein [Pseudovibrio axinellae]SER75547.1 hypothetical protein/Nomega-hydroxy-L-arginine synthase [Pseudovibrio axinellae]